MKVLQINSVYGAGSTGKLTQALHQGLCRDGWESIVLYGRGPSADEPGVFRVCSEFYGKANAALARTTGLAYGGCLLSTSKIINIIRREKPDVVHLQCINEHFVNIYRLISWLKKNEIPTVLTLHAEFMYTANCGHAMDCEKWKSGCGNCPDVYRAVKSRVDRTAESYRKMKEAFCGFSMKLRIVSVSPWLEQRAETAPILKGKQHLTIPNGVDTHIFYLRDYKDLQEQYNREKRNVIFHATALFRNEKDDPKGGWYLLQAAEKLKNILFIVAGKSQVSEEEVPPNVIMLGEIRDQNRLAAFYTMADLTVITSKRETYSMVCAESLCCGTPVIGFCAGAPERISLPRYSEFLEERNVDLLVQCMLKWVGEKANIPSNEIAFAAQQTYDIDMMVQHYEDLYRRVLCS